MGFGKYKKYQETQGPLPEAFEFLNEMKVVEEQVNQTYDHNIAFHLNPEATRSQATLPTGK